MESNDALYADAEALMKREEKDSAIRQTQVILAALVQMLAFLQQQHGCVVEVGKSDKGIHVRVDGRQLL